MTTLDNRKGVNVTIYHNIRDVFDLVLTVTDQDENAVNLSGKSLTFSIRATEGGTALFTATTASGITIGGTSNNVITFSTTFADLEEKSYFCDLDNTTDNKTIFDGLFVASYSGR